MSLRIFSAGTFALLAACDTSPPPPGDMIECAIGAGAELSPVCSLERTASGSAIVLHHPDGGFRRVMQDASTGALLPVDGAEPLTIRTRDAGTMQFTIGQDRYRVPLSLLAQRPR